MITEKHQQRFDTVVKMLAQPYALDREFKITKINYPQGFSTSAGLITTVLDMARYDIAIDQNKFLTKETQQLAFTPAVSTKGESLPYGLGWFTQNYKGTKLLWHYGYWTGNSSFILKVPEQNITFIIMANSDNLSRTTGLGAGDALTSPVGMAFLKTFIFPEKFGESIPEISWNAPVTELKNQLNATAGKPYADLYRKELVTKFRIYVNTGRQADALQLMKMYGELYSKPMPDDLVKLLSALQEEALISDVMSQGVLEHVCELGKTRFLVDELERTELAHEPIDALAQVTHSLENPHREFPADHRGDLPFGELEVEVVDVVGDEEIVEAMLLLARTEGIFTETAGGVTVGVLAKLAKEGVFAPGERVVALITGMGLKTLEYVVGRAEPTVTIAPSMDDFTEKVELGVIPNGSQDGAERLPGQDGAERLPGQDGAERLPGQDGAERLPRNGGDAS